MAAALAQHWTETGWVGLHSVHRRDTCSTIHLQVSNWYWAAPALVVERINVKCIHFNLSPWFFPLLYHVFLYIALIQPKAGVTPQMITPPPLKLYLGRFWEIPESTPPSQDLPPFSWFGEVSSDPRIYPSLSEYTLLYNKLICATLPESTPHSQNIPLFQEL